MNHSKDIKLGDQKVIVQKASEFYEKLREQLEEQEQLQQDRLERKNQSQVDSDAAKLSQIEQKEDQLKKEKDEADLQLRLGEELL